MTCSTFGVVRALPCLAAVLLVACGGGDGITAGGETPPIPVVDLAITGQAVTKVRTAGTVVALLEERLTSIFEDGPQRTLALLQSDGHTLHPYIPPAGWSVVDFVVHPSGDVSAVLTTSKQVRIVRLDRNGSVRSDQSFLDPAAASDPFFDYAGGVRENDALQPVLMHDAARLAPLNESLAVVLRTGRNAIVAYRLDPDVNGVYQRAWRTLIEPGSSILGIGITSGSFDVFGELENHVRIYVDVDSTGTLAVGVVDVPFFNFTFRAHTEQPLLALLNADGSLVQNLGFPGGARHNQLSTIASLDGRWLLGGMVNGPGTHSGDAQPELIVADGFLQERPDLPTE